MAQALAATGQGSRTQAGSGNIQVGDTDANGDSPMTYTPPPAIGWSPPGTPLEDYFALDAMSSSRLKRLARSPAHYRYREDHPKPDTDATRFGSAVHTAVLELDRYDREYAILPEKCEEPLKSGKACSYNAKVSRDGTGYCGRHDPRKGEPVGKQLTEAEEARVHDICSALIDHPTAFGLLWEMPGQIERTGVFRDPEAGVLCKCRPDRVVDVEGEGRFCVDLKTARNASPRAFSRAITDYGYHVQAAFYRRGLAALGVTCSASVLVAVESDPPHGVGCYLLDEDDLARADEEISGLLAEYQRCRLTDNWPAYSGELVPVRLPEWAFQQER